MNEWKCWKNAVVKMFKKYNKKKVYKLLLCTLKNFKNCCGKVNFPYSSGKLDFPAEHKQLIFVLYFSVIIDYHHIFQFLSTHNANYFTTNNERYFPWKILNVKLRKCENFWIIII